jgi:hypothetical protein
VLDQLVGRDPGARKRAGRGRHDRQSDERQDESADCRRAGQAGDRSRAAAVAVEGRGRLPCAWSRPERSPSCHARRCAPPSRPS